MQLRIFPTFRWGLVVTVAYVTLIFATVGIAPSMIVRLDGLGYLKPAVGLVFVLLAGAMLVAVAKAGRLARPSFWLTVVALAAVYVGVSRMVVAVSEQLHLAIYCLLAVMVFCTGRFRLQGAALYAVAAFVTLATGIADEGVQYFLPSRVFDLHDIAINIMGGASGLLALRFMLGDRGDPCVC